MYTNLNGDVYNVWLYFLHKIGPEFSPCINLLELLLRKDNHHGMKSACIYTDQLYIIDSATEQNNEIVYCHKSENINKYKFKAFLNFVLPDGENHCFINFTCRLP